MSLIQRLGKASIIYTITNIFQQGINFLLLPLYTRYLTPNDYGIFAVVGSINSFLSIFFTLALDGSMTRFYFDYYDQPERLKRFWGSILTFILILSAIFGGLLLFFGEKILKPIIGNIPFFPFIALGIAALIFQPFFSIYISLLQTREKPGLYAIFSLSQFILSLILTIVFIVFQGWGAEGALTARLLTAVLFFFICIYALKNQIYLGINWLDLKQALIYSLPLVPHTLSGQLLSMTDKLFLNTIVNTTTAGLYNVAFLLGSVMSTITSSINRAYVPVYMEVLKSENKQQLDELKEIGLILVTIYCLLGSAVSLFSKEILMLMTAESFWEGYKVMPLIAFNFVATGIYYLLVNILFYVKSATKFIAIGTGLSTIINILFNWLLIPKYGLIGAAIATLISQILATIFIGLIGKKYEKIMWHYVKFALIFTVSLIISTAFAFFDYLNLWQIFGIKLLVLATLFLILNTINWNQPDYLARYGIIFIKKRLIKNE